MKRIWYVLHVRPRTEKKVFAYLERYGFFRHLPTYVKVYKNKQRRRVRVELPLFPGYVFTRLLPEERLTMLKTNLIVATIPVERPREMVHQLRQVNRASKSDAQLKTMAKTFKAGDYVRIKSGPMRGTEGYVMYDGSRATLCLNVEILGACVSMSVSPDDVEKV